MQHVHRTPSSALIPQTPEVFASMKRIPASSVATNEMSALLLGPFARANIPQAAARIHTEQNA